jgi:hypothetical protein
MFKKIEKIAERKLNCNVTPEMIQDLLNFRNVDASVELEILKEYEKEQKRILREKKLKRILDDNEY